MFVRACEGLGGKEVTVVVTYKEVFGKTFDRIHYDTQRLRMRIISQSYLSLLLFLKI